MANRSSAEPRERFTLTTGVPVARVGWLIAQARINAALSERELAKHTGVRKRVVRRWESARQVPNDREVSAVASACGLDLDELLPPRDVIEFDAAAHYMRVGSASVSMTEVHNEAVLATYVSLVREQRNLKLGEVFTFRQQDLDALCDALDLEDDDLENRLVRVTGLDAEQAAEIHRKLMRRRLALPAVGLLAGSSIGLVRAADHNGSAAPAPIVVEHRAPPPSSDPKTSIAVAIASIVVTNERAIDAAPAPAPAPAPALATPAASVTPANGDQGVEFGAAAATAAAASAPASTEVAAPDVAPPVHSDQPTVVPQASNTARRVALVDANKAPAPAPVPVTETSSEVVAPVVAPTVDASPAVVVPVEIGDAAGVVNLNPPKP